MTDEPQLRSQCPVAGFLDLLGDRWTLLVVRDLLFFDKHLFSDFENGPEGISTNTLADRLRRLEDQGIIARTAYQEAPVRYRYDLTDKGRDLRGVLREAVLWGARHVPGVMQPPKGF